MALFGGYRMLPNGGGEPEWFKKITSVFGYMDYEDQSKDRGVAISDTRKMLVPSYGENGDIVGAQFYGNMRRYINYDEPTKLQKLAIYRQMADYAEIKYALSMICDEILNYSDLDGNVGRMEIVNPAILDNINKRDNLRKEWNYIFDELMNFKDTGRDSILSFLISGELIFEKVVNPDRKQDGIKKVKRLRPDNVFPVWKDDLDGIEYFNVKSSHFGGGGVTGTIPKSQLAYVNWDYYTHNPETGDIYTLSYLEPVKKVWRQLQLLEEALVIYRIVRAPERRIFKVAIGDMPRAQAEAYVQKVMRAYRQKKIYNTSSGEVDGQSNIMSMMEDYWFAQPKDGNTTEIETLPGGQNLGEITDINYFLEKLYRALEIPANRRIETPTGDQKFNNGSIGDVSWQEVKFSKMVHRVRRKTVQVIFDIYKTHLKLKGFWDQYNLKDSDIRIELNKNNYFEELKRANIEESRLNAWGTVSSYIGDVFSKEMAVKHFLHWSDEEWQKNKMLLEKEKLEGDVDVEGGGGGGGGGLSL
jgi:hypothetical protein